MSGSHRPEAFANEETLIFLSGVDAIRAVVLTVTETGAPDCSGRGARAQRADQATHQVDPAGHIGRFATELHEEGDIDGLRFRQPAGHIAQQSRPVQNMSWRLDLGRPRVEY